MSFNLTAYLNQRFQWSYSAAAYAALYAGNIASAVWRMQIRPYAGSPTVTLDFATGGSPQNAALTANFDSVHDIVTFCGPTSVISNLAAGQYYFDFGLILPGADFERVDGGTITFAAGVTLAGVAGTPGAPVGADDTVTGGANPTPSPVPTTLDSAIAAANSSAVSAGESLSEVLAAANAAAASASQAATSATNANASASAIGGSAASVASYASAAQAAATTASTAASQAGTSVSAAGASAVSASNSAAAAASSASSAANSASAAQSASSAAVTQSTASYWLDVLTVSATNTVSNLTHAWSGGYAIVFVNGTGYPSNAASPAFTISSGTLTWSATNSGVTLTPGTTQVFVLYSTVAPGAFTSATFLSMLTNCANSFPTSAPGGPGVLWNDNGVIQLSQTGATALSILAASLAAETSRAEAAEAAETARAQAAETAIKAKAAFQFAYAFMRGC